MDPVTPAVDHHDPIKIAVVTGSTRPTRRSLAIATWVLDGPPVPGVDLELVDLIDLGLPMLREPIAAAFGQYEYPETRAWSELAAGFDGYVLVTPEYNASTSAVLKNALDHLYVEWHDKAVAFVGYGNVGGVRAVEHLRGITAELKLAGIAQALHLHTSQVVDGMFQATQPDQDARDELLADLARWARSFRELRRTGA